MYSKTEVSRLALDQLDAGVLREAHEAFCGFANEFGCQWIDELFRGSKSPMDVLFILSLWNDWRAVKSLSSHDKIRRRWANGMLSQGVVSEVRVIAHLLRMGLDVQLEPSVSKAIPDLRFRDDGGWVYCEVSQRGATPVLARAQKTLHQLAEAASAAIPGLHGKVGVIRDISEKEISILLDVLASSPGPGLQMVGDFAIFRADSLETTLDQSRDIVEQVPEPKLFTTYVGHGIKGSAAVCVPDLAANEMLKRKARQLSTERPGILFLDLSRMISPMTGWRQLIERRLGRGFHSRVSAAVIYQTVLSERGPRTAGYVLVNPRAKYDLSDSTAQIIESFVPQPTLIEK